jgi:hypothetical protein
MAPTGVVFDARLRTFTSRSFPRVRYRGLTKALRRSPISLSSTPRKRTPAGVKAYGRRSASAVDRAISRAVATETYDTLTRGEAKAFFDALREWKLRPLSAQVAVCDPRARVATALDLLAVDRLGRCVVLEVKCGYAGTFDAGGPLLSRGPLRGMRSTPFLFACVQAAVGAHMYERCAGARVCRVGVVQIERERVSLHPVADAVMARVPKVIRGMRAARRRRRLKAV